MGGCLSSPPKGTGTKNKQAPPQQNGASAPKEDPLGGLDEQFDVRRFLGSGSTGDAYLVVDNLTKQVVCAKLIKRPIATQLAQGITREIKIQAQLGKGHVNIVKPIDVVLTRTHLGMIMEYVSGGNLVDYIMAKVKTKYGSFDQRSGLVLDEEEALYFFKQIISALSFCHEHRIAHRDMKLDNTLLDTSDPPRIKLCDFGYANWWEGEAAQMNSFIGTPDYMSPQLLGPENSYDATKADVWAIGVQLCTMLLGKFPFDGTDMADLDGQKDVCKQIYSRQVSGRWRDAPTIVEDVKMISPECRDLLDKIFDLDEKKRIGVAGIVAHPWYKGELSPRYQAALEAMNHHNAKTYDKVKTGYYVNHRRDSALQRLVIQATLTSGDNENAGMQRLSHSMVQRISLVRVQTEFDMDANIPKVDEGGEGDEDADSGGKGKDVAKGKDQAAPAVSASAHT